MTTPYTLVSFHAHPDDEALLTGGTLARAAAEGHRVVLVTATDGALGLAGDGDGCGAALAALRLEELQAAAAALGCARVVCLGYADSGLHAESPDPRAFARADPEEAAHRLAEVLLDERADVVTSYDPNGGYGHPDHVQVHRVGARAARIAGTPVVLEATVPAGAFRTALRLLRLAGRALGRSAPLGERDVFADGASITHRVDVRGHLDAKRRALAAHGSQRRGPGGFRVVEALLRLPAPVFALALGTEWFVQPGLAPGEEQCGHRQHGRCVDVFDTVPRRERATRSEEVR